MSDRDRLIELLKKADDNASKKLITDYDDAIVDNADYLLANGVIVPPCKVGGKVYWINRIKNKIMADKVISVNLYKNGWTITTDTIGTKTTSTYGLNRFLEIMFFTKEEAEQAFKECDKQ